MEEDLHLDTPFVVRLAEEGLQLGGGEVEVESAVLAVGVDEDVAVVVPGVTVAVC